MRDFSHCWHIDQSLSAQQHGKLVHRSRKSRCRAQCGTLAFPEFKLPHGSSQWSSANSEGDQGWHKQSESVGLAPTLGEAWPGGGVCEEEI